MPDLIQLAIDVGIRAPTVAMAPPWVPSPNHREEATDMTDKKKFARPRVVRRKEKLASIVQFVSAPGINDDPGR